MIWVKAASSQLPIPRTGEVESQNFYDLFWLRLGAIADLPRLFFATLAACG